MKKEKKYKNNAMKLTIKLRIKLDFLSFLCLYY